MNMKDSIMKRLIAMISILTFTAVWRDAEAFAPHAVHVKGPQMMEAVEESNAKLLKSLLFHKQELPKKEKAHLLKRAKEIAYNRKKGISLLRSFWDAAYVVAGGYFAFCYLSGIDILGNTAECNSAALILSETSLDEVQASLTDPEVRAEVKDAMTEPNRLEILQLRQQGKIKPNVVIEDPSVSGMFHRVSMRKSLQEAAQKKAAEKAKEVAEKAKAAGKTPAPVVQPVKKPVPPLVPGSDEEKQFKKYKKWHDKLFGNYIGLMTLGAADTILGWAGIYCFARGWFCMNARSEYTSAQHIVDILEKVPELEERLS